MLRELKGLFTTRKGLLVFLAIATALVTAYLNLITLKGTPAFWIFDTGISYGTLLVSFIPMLIGDLLAEVYGWKKSFIISSVSYTLALIFVLILWGTTKMPGLVFGQDGFPVDAYSAIFGQQPSILIGSAVAYYVGIFFNAFIMGKMQKKAQESGNDNSLKFFARCILSTVVGQFLDNALFFLIAYGWALGDPTLMGFPAVTEEVFADDGVTVVDVLHGREILWNYIWQQILAAFVVEVGYEIILFPVTKILTRTVERLPETLPEVNA